MADIIYVPKSGYDANDYTTGAIKSDDTPGTNVNLVDDTEYVALAKTTINNQPTYTQPAAVGWDIDAMYNGGKRGYRFEFDDIGPTGTVFTDLAWTTHATADDDNIFSVLDKSPNAKNISWVTEGGAPTSLVKTVNGQTYWEANLGAVENLLEMQTPFDTNLAVTGMSIFVAFRTTTAQGVLAGGGNGQNVGTFQTPPNTNNPIGGFTGTPTYHTDGGAAIATPDRGDLHTLWATGNWVIGSAENFIVPANVFMHPAANRDAGSFSITGDILAAISIENPTAADRSGIISHLQTKITNAETP